MSEYIFRQMLDGMRPATVSALMDLADGMWMAVFEWPMIFHALESRGLARIEALRIVGHVSVNCRA